MGATKILVQGSTTPKDSAPRLHTHRQTHRWWFQLVIRTTALSFHLSIARSLQTLAKRFARMARATVEWNERARTGQICWYNLHWTTEIRFYSASHHLRYRVMQGPWIAESTTDRSGQSYIDQRWMSWRNISMVWGTFRILVETRAAERCIALLHEE